MFDDERVVLLKARKQFGRVTHRFEEQIHPDGKICTPHERAVVLRHLLLDAVKFVVPARRANNRRHAKFDQLLNVW